MIEYLTGFWGIGFIWRRRGSVFHKALVWALTSSILAVAYNRLIHSSGIPAPSFLTNDYVVAPITAAFGLSTGVLSFLLVFRNQQGYKIWIEAGVLLKTVRSSWFNAFSSLIAFRTRDESRLRDVQEFHNFLMRLMSLLYCTALQQVLDQEKDTLEVIDLHGIDREHLEFLTDADDRAEVIHQWVQRLIVKAEDEKVVQIAAPILGRVYSDLAAGMVALQKARRISEFPFPFPYAQMLTVLLLVITFVQPMIAATFITSPFWAGLLSFVGVFTLWSISYVAQEIERPFGDSANDLPLIEMQLSFNQSLTALLEKNAMTPPIFSFDKAKNQRVPLADGIVAHEDGPPPPTEDILPVLRNNTLAYSPARRSDSIPVRSGTRLASMAAPARRGLSMAAGGTPSRKHTVRWAADVEADDVEAGESRVFASSAAGTKPPKLIRKIGPQEQTKRPEGVSAEASELEKASSMMSV
jgi:predicted membrane chloride channel (bestrophin family)